MCATELDKQPSRARVWVVDDSALQGDACGRVLAAQYDVQVYLDGATMLEAMSAGAAPDLLVLDWHMPDLSGLEVCRCVRENMNLAKLPIVILTATRQSESLIQAFAAGANDFVVKPFSSTELEARVTSLIRARCLHVKLSEAEQKLRIEAQFREKFIGILAHDLRQPLSTLMLANEALRRTTAAPEFLEVQKRAAVRMSNMVAELLDFTRSRQESGMPIQPEFINFEDVARGILKEVQIAHPDRELHFTVEGPCSGHWDRDRLAQLCSNLLTNAVGHGAASSSIEIRLVGGHDQVTFTVTNRGTRIPADILANIFEPFRQGRDAKKGSGGLGLGLYIVSEIARAHKGKVAAWSDESATSFSVALPAKI